MQKNIVLIGMPGSGKSTVGVILAKVLAMGFVDTDVLIQMAERRTLQEIVDSEGHLRLREIEERVILTLSHCGDVIATGGSAVYSAAAMDHLRENGTIVLLDVSIETLESRVKDYSSRGLAKRPGQSFEDLYRERLPLYRKYADVRIGCDGLTHEEVCGRIVGEVGGRRD